MRQDDGERTLIGSGGYAAPPGTDGTVEVGYAIVAAYQRKGYTSGVLRNCGFLPDGDGSAPGVIRFTLSRTMYSTNAAEQHPGR